MSNGDDGKRDGMDRVERNADAAWKLAALQAAYKAAIELPYFTSDDVVARMPANVSTHDQRAMGPIMKNAASYNWIAKAAMPGRNSNRASLHSSPRTVWESLLFMGEDDGLSPHA